MSVKTATITASEQFTDPVYLAGSFNVSIRGTFVGKITVQRSFIDNEWGDITPAFTSPIEDVGFEPEGCLYRIGAKAGEFVSGSAAVRIGK